MKSQTLSIDLLCTDGGTQSRATISEEVLADYASLVSESEEWPFNEPVDVFHDGNTYYVADGFHRVMGCHRTKRASIPCRVRQGSAHDALLFGMKANVKHGLRRSNEDKRHCVNLLLDGNEKLNQKKVAELAAVSVRLVRAIVAERKPSPTPHTDAHGARQVKGDDAPQNNRHGACSNGGDDAPFGPDQDDEPEKPKPKSKPPKQYERPALLRQWEGMMGPMVRWVDNAAKGLGESQSESHKVVQEHLNIATEELMEWMGK